MNMTKAEKQALLTIASIYSLRMLGLFMILPVFSVYAKQLSGVSPLAIGIALGVYGLTQAIFQIPFGYMSDRLGRKPLIIIGLLLLALGSLVAALSQSILGVIVGRAIQGMGAIGGVLMAFVADITQEETRLRAMAYIGVTIGLSFALAFILGPLLNGFMGVQGIFWLTVLFSLLAIGLIIGLAPSETNIRGLALTSGVAGSDRAELNNAESNIVGTHIVGSHVAESKGPNTAADRANIELRKVALFPLFPLYGGVLILHASLTAVFLKIPQMVLDFEFENLQIWKFYLPVLLISFVFTIPIILLMEKTKQIKNIMAWVVLLLAIGESGIWLFSNSFLGFSLSLGLFFTAFNVLEASLPSLISKNVTAELKGTALGIFSALQFLGLFLGGTLGGFFDSCGGLVAVLSFCVILALGWFFWIFHTSWNSNRNSNSNDIHLNSNNIRNCN